MLFLFFCFLMSSNLHFQQNKQFVDGKCTASRVTFGNSLCIEYRNILQHDFDADKYLPSTYCDFIQWIFNLQKGSIVTFVYILIQIFYCYHSWASLNIDMSILRVNKDYKVQPSDCQLSHVWFQLFPPSSLLLYNGYPW